MSYRFIFSFVMCVALLAACGEDGENTEQPTEQSESAVQSDLMSGKSIPEPCGEGGLFLNDIVGVSGEHELRSLPDKTAAKVKNEKASRILGKDHYHQIDGSTTVRRVCVQPQWTEIRVVTPDWLTHVTGWVPNAAIREIERSSSGQRVYVDDDFYWDGDTSKYKEQIISVVNKIAHENSKCRNIDTASVAKSSSKSKRGDPVFFVTCGTGANVFNVWFRPTDASSDNKFVAKQPIAKGAAVDACEATAKAAATHPSTVEFSRVWDLAYMPHVSGRARVISSFTAKNAFNLELKYRIDCLFDGAMLIETNIAESY